MEQLIGKYLNDEYGQIIYAGVGHSSVLESILSLEYKSLLLIEPIEPISAKLERKFASGKVTVKNVALSPAGGIGNFTVMQPAKYSSLQKDITLEHVLKNSAVISVESIQTISLPNLIKESKLVATDNNILILSINGSEFDCLDSVKIEELSLFSTLLIQIENQGIYTQNIDSDIQLKSLLRKKGFYFEDMQQEGAIFTNLVFKKNDAMLGCIGDLQQSERKNQEERSKVNRLLDESEKHKAEFIPRISNLEAQNAELVARSSQLETQNLELAQKIEQLQNQLAKLKQNKEAEKAELVARSSKLEAEKAELVERNSQLETKNSELATRSSKLEDEKQQLAEEKANAEKQSEAQRQELAKKVEQLQNQLVQVKQSKETEKAELVELNSQLETKNSELATRRSKLEAENSELVASQSKSESEKHEFNELFEQRQTQCQRQIQQLTEQVEIVKKQLENEEQESEELKRSERLNQKMLVKAQVDLDGLRGKYAEKVEQESEFITLIQELRDKLTIASQYYLKLQQAHPEISSELAVMSSKRQESED